MICCWRFITLKEIWRDIGHKNSIWGELCLLSIRRSVARPWVDKSRKTRLWCGFDVCYEVVLVVRVCVCVCDSREQSIQDARERGRLQEMPRNCWGSKESSWWGSKLVLSRCYDNRPVAVFRNLVLYWSDVKNKTSVSYLQSFSVT